MSSQIGRIFRYIVPVFVLTTVLAISGLDSSVYARDASGKGDPEFGAGHTTPHGVKPGRGISGKPEDHGKGSTSHVPGPKGGHEDDESHSDDDGSHDDGKSHVPGGKGGKGGSAHAENDSHEDESGHEEGEEHEEGHEPGPKKGGGHEDEEEHDHDK